MALRPRLYLLVCIIFKKAKKIYTPSERAGFEVTRAILPDKIFYTAGAVRTVSLRGYRYSISLRATASAAFFRPPLFWL